MFPTNSPVMLNTAPVNELPVESTLNKFKYSSFIFFALFSTFITIVSPSVSNVTPSFSSTNFAVYFPLFPFVNVIFIFPSIPIKPVGGVSVIVNNISFSVDFTVIFSVRPSSPVTNVPPSTGPSIVNIAFGTGLSSSSTFLN